MSGSYEHHESYAIDEAALSDFALRLIREASLSGEEGAVADLVAGEMERLGLEVERDELGNVTGTLDAGPGPCILVDSHMDTVGVTDASDWSHSPEGEFVGARIYGRGAMDMKGPLAAAVYGVAALKGKISGGKVIVSATVAEELVEGPATERVAERVGPDFAVICEATSLKVAHGQRGRAELEVEAFGRSTHSSRPDLGTNAAEAMSDVVRALREVPVPIHEILGQGILVLTDVISRPYPGLSVVPDYCKATFDRRTLPGETEESVLEPVREALQRALEGTGASGKVSISEDDFKCYTGAEVRASNFAPAWFYDLEAPVVQTVLEGVGAAGLSAEESHYAFCTNGSGTAGRLGIPTIGFGPGNEELAHRVDEYIEVVQLVDGARGYASILEHLTAAITAEETGK